MKVTRLFLIALFALGVLLLSACATPAAGNWPGLAADSEQAYVTAGTFLYAVNLQNGSEVWRFPAKAQNGVLFYANPLITPDGQLLIGSAGTTHALFNVDAKTGKENWPAPFTGAKGPWLATPLVWNDLIYAPNADGSLYVLRLNGEYVDAIQLGGKLWSKPVTDGTYLYVASLDHHLHIIDLASRNILKTIDIGGAIADGLTVGPQGVFVGSLAAKMERVTPDGQVQTLAQAEGWLWGAPAILDDTLYFADLNGNLYSVNVNSAAQNWSNIKPDGPITASPVLFQDKIIVATEEGSVFAFDRQGKDAWPRPYVSGGKIYTTPVVSGEMILVAPFQAQFTLAALDGDGREIWKFTPER
jgi:outer membrane protein assembly factor BamB